MRAAIASDSTGRQSALPTPAPGDPGGFAAGAMPPRLDSLTTLRFVAAVMIVTGHGTDVFGISLGNAIPGAINVCVSFFFVLSGFVLAYNYPALGDRRAVRAFYVMRFARLWPLYLFAMLVTVAALPYGAWVDRSVDRTLATLLSVTLTQTWFLLINGYAAAYIGPAWTLSIDVFFYLAFPWLLVRVREQPWRTLAGTLLLSVACPLVSNALGAARSDAPMDEWNWYLLDRTFPLARLAEFTLGMVAAQYHTSVRAWMPTGARTASVVELAALSLCALAMGNIHWMPWMALWTGAGVADWLSQVALAPLFAVTIMILAQGRGVASRALAAHACVHLGELSFAVYLLHIVVLSSPVWKPLTATLGWPLAMAAFWLVLLALAHLAWRIVELPARRWIIATLRPRAVARSMPSTAP